VTPRTQAPRTQAPPLLEVDDLTVWFGAGTPAIDAVSLRMTAGQRTGLIGESGSGKSVTALAIMGLLPDTARTTGAVRLAGTDMLGASDRRRSRIRGDVASMVFQEPMTALDPTMIVGRQVAEVVGLHGASAGERREPTKDRVLRMLAEVELADPARIAGSFPHQLSGGQRQRVVIAMAMINNPDLIICDEPTTALDVTVQARVLDLLRRALDTHGTACLFISHDLAVVAQVCDQVMVMLDGQIVERGPLATVFNRPEHPYTRGLVATSRLDAVEVGARLPTIDDFVDSDAGTDDDVGSGDRE
jgi:peptide/nickel transport system ATP-binding protein